jgi:cyanophycinase
MVAFGDEGDTPRQGTAGLAAGLGLIPGVVIDQHFGQRTRFGRLLSLVARSPSLLGVGVDEDTAAVIRGGRLLEVVGSGSVFIADGATVVSDAPLAAHGAPLLVSGAIVHTLPAGAQFDLWDRRLVSFEEHNPARVRHEPEEDQ